MGFRQPRPHARGLRRLLGLRHVARDESVRSREDESPPSFGPDRTQQPEYLGGSQTRALLQGCEVEVPANGRHAPSLIGLRELISTLARSRLCLGWANTSVRISETTGLQNRSKPFDRDSGANPVGRLSVQVDGLSLTIPCLASRNVQTSLHIRTAWTGATAAGTCTRPSTSNARRWSPVSTKSSSQRTDSRRHRISMHGQQTSPGNDSRDGLTHEVNSTPASAKGAEASHADRQPEPTRDPQGDLRGT